jgi:xylulokinase
MSRHILVLDVGTSALKAVVFDAAGRIVASREAGYGPAPGPHRQSLNAWWAAAREAIAALDRPNIDAVVLSGTMENLIPVDGSGNAVGNAILYSDPCGTAALDRHQAALDEIGAGSILGNAPEPLMTAFKVAWLREAHPAVYARARYFFPGAKDAVALRLTGEAVTDPVTAATTGLMDLAARDWSAPLIDTLGVPAEKLPAIRPAGEIIGTVTAAAAEIGIATGTPVVNGCGDGGATTLGSFCREAGDVSLYLGTTGWVARVTADTEPDERIFRLAHPSPGFTIAITPILSAGAAGTWVRTVLGISTGERDAVLAEADWDPKDLVFLPYLAGERFPFLDTEVRGAFVGLDAAHMRGDLYYAVLEGVGFAIRANLKTLDPAGTGRVRLVGGGAESAVWPQMLADILGRAILVPPFPEFATAMGAFLVAAQALGFVVETPAAARTCEPRPDRAMRADRLARSFQAATAAARRLGSRATWGEARQPPRAR